jgi:hypothetical protein
MYLHSSHWIDLRESGYWGLFENLKNGSSWLIIKKGMAAIYEHSMRL